MQPAKPFRSKLNNPFRAIPFLLLVTLIAAALPVLLWANEKTGKTETEIYSLKIAINAPADFIFPYLIEEDKIALWNKDKTVTVKFPKGKEPRVGKQIHVTINMPFHPSLLMEIVTLKPMENVETKFMEGPLEGSFSYLLISRQNGTLLVHQINIRPASPLMRLIWVIYGKRAHKEKMGAFLKEIKIVVEKQYAQHLRSKGENRNPGQEPD